MTPDALLAALRTEGARIAAMPVDALDAPVPTVPGWTLEHVVRHTGKVHRWVDAILDAGPAVDIATVRVESLPHGPDSLDGYRASLDTLLARFDDLDPAAPAMSFVGPATVGWWMRRQAHEATVHRFDAADAVHAAGGPPPDTADAATSADGIDELTELQLLHRVKYDGMDPRLAGRTIHLHGTDVPDAEWLLTIENRRIVAEHAHAKADVALRGSVQDLLLIMWRRRPIDVVDTFGDVSIVEGLLDVARF
ncbi:maleylpyruvate isomerase N-terminal domain-containing protein [Actinomycetes bacterium M1A6_2h]